MKPQYSTKIQKIMRRKMFESFGLLVLPKLVKYWDQEKSTIVNFTDSR